MMALTLEALQRGRRMDLPSCLRMEDGLVQYALSCGEFNEGVRAHLIDKDRSPSWVIASVEALSDQAVASAWATAQTMSRDLLAQ